MNQGNGPLLFGVAIVFALTTAVSVNPASAQTLTAHQDTKSVVHISAADSETKSRADQFYGELPLSFETNEGQTDPRVKFLARGSGYTLFLTGEEAVLALTSAGSHEQKRPARKTIVRMGLSGANPASDISGMEQLPGKSNYFIGNDAGKWRTDVPQYAKVRYRDVYPGVDLVYYGSQGKLEYDFLLAPGANPEAIALKIQPALPPTGKNQLRQMPLRIDHDGNLVMELNGEVLSFHKPVAYQGGTVSTAQSKIEGRKFIDARYVLTSHNQVGIRLAAYDKAQPLVIDPVIWYSSYLGGSAADQASAVAVDSAGNVYVAGFTESSDFPQANQISDACQAGCGNNDAFVTKINASGRALVYSSYLGGNRYDAASGIAVDSYGNVYVTGSGNSSNFPRVNQIPGACQGDCGDGSNSDAFVTKINAAGNALVYSSLIGGSNLENDIGFGAIAVDGSGNAYITGTTYSTDFPQVNQIPGACLGSCGEGTAQDVFVTKINAAGSALVYSSYVGSSGTDIGFGIAVDGSGNAYLTGLTLSSDFPRVNQIAGACIGDCSNSLNYDVYVTKVNAAGTALVYSSYIGGSDQDYGRGITVDGSGNAYLAGRASSTDFPQVNQIPNVCAQNTCGAFAVKIDAAGDALVYSSRFGGSIGTQAHAIAVDNAGSVYVTGETQADDFPQLNPIMGGCRGTCGTGANHDGFVTKIDAAGDALVYSSYLGGSGDDNGGAIICNSSVAVDTSHNAFLSGCTLSADFPQGRLEVARPMSIAGACKGSCGTGASVDAFVVKISQ